MSKKRCLSDGFSKIDSFFPATCLGKFGEIIQTVEDERIRILGQAEHAYLEVATQLAER